VAQKPEPSGLAVKEIAAPSLEATAQATKDVAPTPEPSPPVQEVTAPMPPPSIQEEQGAVPAETAVSLGPSHADESNMTIPPDHTLTYLARKQYGATSETLLDLIQMANEDISSIHQIREGQTIVWPKITRESMVVQGDNGKFHIHYASFHAKGNAQRTTDRLLKNGYEAFFVSSLQGKTEIHRVYIGSFSAKTETDNVLKDIDFKNLPFLNSLESQAEVRVNHIQS
jgi:hypothetical protein